MFEWESAVEPARRRRTGLALGIALAAFVLMLAGALAGVPVLRDSPSPTFERLGDPFGTLTDRPGSHEPADASDPVNLLLLGSDSRSTADDPGDWVYGGQRADAIMLVQVAGDRRSVTAMSVPRDSWVEIPGHGPGKINAAFSFGGPALMVETLEALTGIRIDHVAVADFSSFVGLTDDLGGVELTLSQPLTTGGTTLEAGSRVLDGAQALAYTRERYDVPGGDLGRVQRQQAWLRAVMEAAEERGVLDDPSQALRIAWTLMRSVAVDEGLGVPRLLGLAIGLRDLDRAGIRFLTAPTVGTGWSPDGTQSIVLLDELLLEEVSAAFRDDRIAELLDADTGRVTQLGAQAP
ncbi:LCP family protein [Georgenia alba]|uniref:LCP family protein n=1 Tax=Georgenia alba TaxID=2233858 RepID=A0ABW2Q561_9MICO